MTKVLELIGEFFKKGKLLFFLILITGMEIKFIEDEAILTA